MPGRPAETAVLSVMRDLARACRTGTRVHFQPRSTARSVARVRQAKADGLPVSCEATTHHFTLTHAECASYDPVFKVNPPLRTEADLVAVRAGLADGAIDCIATYHAPNTQAATESPFYKPPPGMLGWETALALPLHGPQLPTAEATTHHFPLTHAECASYDPVFKVNPPLRTEADLVAVRAGLADGAIDCIATDHAPHTQEAKESAFDQAPPGMLGLETALALALTELDLPIAEVLALLSWNPARVLGVDDVHGGPIAPGRPANLAVIDPEHTWTVDPAAMASRIRNSPYAGRSLRGQVRHTILPGDPVVVAMDPTR